MLKLYNTLTKTKEEFKPIKGKEVGMYTCGPTVYDFPHIGNYRAYIVADLLKRYLQFKGFRVKHIMNITDVDDKIIRDSQSQRKDIFEFTRPFEREFYGELRKLNIEMPDVLPKATDHIKEMQELIKKLLKNDLAYEKDGSIYLSISEYSRAHQYGQLINLEGVSPRATDRIEQDEYEKENVSDFALWKNKKEGEPSWDFKINDQNFPGRPGWHIECSAMSTKYLGPSFDIHTGGIDLVFPHHENEIAQSEGANNQKFVNFWIHNEHLLINGEKMSKSLGNQYTLNDILEKNPDPLAFRYLILSSHYRSKQNFTWEALEAARNTLESLRDFLGDILEVDSPGPVSPKIIQFLTELDNNFSYYLDDDLSTPEALASIFIFIKEVNKYGTHHLTIKDSGIIYQTFLDFDKVLGLKLNQLSKKEELDKELLDLILKREEARQENNFEKADELRQKLLDQGIAIEDTPTGAKWRRIK